MPHQSRECLIGDSSGDDSDDEQDLENYYSDNCFSTCSFGSVVDDDIEDQLALSPDNEGPAESASVGSQNRVENDDAAVEMPPELPPEEMADMGAPTSSKSGRSLANHLIDGRESCFISPNIMTIN